MRLTAPVTVFVRSSNATSHTTNKRTRRVADYSANFDLTQNSPCYIDAIGIPRGVPNEYKLADQIGAGFENIPLLSALFPITPNKNVDKLADQIGAGFENIPLLSALFPITPNKNVDKLADQIGAGFENIPLLSALFPITPNKNVDKLADQIGAGFENIPLLSALFPITPNKNVDKLADQIGAGFENIPLLSALFPITANKNVDRINYIHYNVQRLANLTRDAVEGISTQLAATSLMAFQNRVALDMLLAEKGGVCAMFGEQCCTFIPNNTAPDGSVTKALNGLRALSTKMKEASGTDNPVEAWMRGMFGKWKALAMAIFTSIDCFLAILITCGCCCTSLV